MVSYLLFFNQNYDRKVVRNLFLFFLAILSVYLFKNGSINIWSFGGGLLRVINAYLIVRVFKDMFIVKTVKMVVVLTVVSLIGYLFQLLIPDYFFEVNDLFGLDEGFKVISSSLFFNMNLLIHPNRNCGFMWEPGAFAGVLTAILYLNNNTSIENRKANNIILIIGILTTLSTMGYLTLLVHLFSKVKFKNRVVTASFLIFSIVAIYYLSDEVPFLKEKIIDQIVNLDSELERVTLANKGGYSAGLTRFGSILIDWNLFINNPLIGLGPDIYTTNQDLIYGEFGENVIRASGLMNLLLKFGIIGVLLFFYLQYKSFPSSEKKVKVFWIVLIVFVLFSNPFDTSPFLFSFLFLNKSQMLNS